MINAKEAKELAGPTLDEKIESLGETIEFLAKQKRRQLRTGWDHDADKSLWIDGGYQSTDEWKEAKKKLEEMGYKVSFFYKEGSQFVDMYTLVEW